MNYRLLGLLLLSALICSSVFATMLISAEQRQPHSASQIKKSNFADAGNGPIIICVGDPVEGGGHPLGDGNQTG